MTPLSDMALCGISFTHTYLYVDEPDVDVSIPSLWVLSSDDYSLEITSNGLEYHSLPNEVSAPYHIWRVPFKANRFGRRIAEIMHPIVLDDGRIERTYWSSGLILK